jgi:type 1 fimbriae regulatory protein FimB/type 1 fimbriae regulatory protein FimE
MPAKTHLSLVASEGEKRAVAQGRRPNADFRKREYLTDTEVVQLMDAARTNRYGHRDATMILVAYRHGLRASEVCDLRWDDLNFAGAAIHVARKKNGVPTTQQLNGEELRALRRLQRDQDPKSAFVFATERGGPFDRTSFNFLVKRTGKKAGIPFQVHAHMLRHAAGYALANAGRDTRSIQAYLGHRDIRHTVRYTELSPTRFKNFFPN